MNKKTVAKLLTASLLTFSAMSYASKQAATEKVVVVDGSLTEIVYALNAEDQLLAVDQTSVFPKQATELANVGYMRALSTEGILSLRPKALITTSSAGPIETLEKVKAAGVKVDIVDNQYSIDGLMHKIDTVATLLNKTDNAATLKAAINADLKPLAAVLAGKTGDKKPRVLMFLGMQGNQFMAAGKHTQAQAMMDLLHAENVAGDFNGYKPLSKEAVLAANPDAIIIVSHAQSDTAKVIGQFAYTNAATNKRIIIADSGMLLGFGPRLPEAITTMTKVLYPNFKL